MALSFETKTLDLAGGPIDLLADPDIADGLATAGADGVGVFLQNVSPRAKVYYAERPNAPLRTGKGHCLAPGDGFTLTLATGNPSSAWVWAASTGTIAVSPAA